MSTDSPFNLPEPADPLDDLNPTAHAAEAEERGGGTDGRPVAYGGDREALGGTDG